MTKSELSSVFPGAKLVPEKFNGFIKSWTAIRDRSQNACGVGVEQSLGTSK